MGASASGTFTIAGELTVNRLGFGAMRITGTGIWGPPKDRDECIRVLRRAVDLGVNLVDTADSYGPDVSEELIAEALHPYPGELVIAPKGGFQRPGPDRWEEDGRPEHLRAACEGSLRRLRVERIDLYQLHRIDPKVPAEDQLATLRDLHAEGKIRHIGLSEVSVEQLRLAQDAIPVASVQNLYNVRNRRSESVLEVCGAEGIAFLPWYPLNVGKLTRSGSPVEAVASTRGATPAQVALAWLLARSPVMLPIPGTSSVAHLEENVAAAELHLSPDEVESIGAV